MRAQSEVLIPRVDGRRARGERTRLKVLESLLSLLEEGQLRPTAQQVAEHAGVALRTVYHHFDDVEALRHTALSLQLSRSQKIFEDIDPALPLEERARQYARQCRRLFEAITPIRRAALMDESNHEAMPPDLAEIIHRRREQLEATFASELSQRGAVSRDLVDATDAGSSWLTWYFLRYELGRSAPATERVFATTIVELLQPRR